VLEDVTHQMLAYAGATDEADAIAAEWGAHSRAIHERHPPPLRTAGRAPTARAGSFSDVVACARRPVVLRGESWGWLHLLHGTVRPSPSDLSTLERAAAAIAITLLSERESGARAAQRAGTLLTRLQLGDITGEKFVARALALGQDLRERDLIVAVTGREAGGEPFAEQDLVTVLRTAGWPAVVGDIGDFDLAVAGLPPGLGDGALVEALGGRGAWGGVSRVVTPAMLPTAIRQGRSAAAVAATGTPRQLMRFDELGALRLLVALAEGPELARYVEDELGSLLEHDARATSPLLPTLRAYLNCGGNKARAAEELFVQRRTLYYRLERLSAILGLDLGDVETQPRPTPPANRALADTSLAGAETQASARDDHFHTEPAVGDELLLRGLVVHDYSRYRVDWADDERQDGANLVAPGQGNGLNRVREHRGFEFTVFEFGHRKADLRV